MKKGLWSSLTALVASTGISQADEPPIIVVPPASPVQAAPVYSTPLMDYTQGPAYGAEGHCDACQKKPWCGPRSWVQGESLLWWVRGNPIPPLATLGNPANAVPGAIGQPGTTVIVNDQVSYGEFLGARIGFGHWFGAEGRWGVEAGGFLLAQKSQSRNFTDPNGLGVNPDLFVPFFANPPGAEGAVPNNPIGYASTLQLWGAEINGLWNWKRTDCWTVDFLAGARYVDMNEELAFFGGFGPGLSTTDNFSARNQFYGGQIGAKVGYRTGNFSANVVGKLGLGTTHRTVDILGQTNIGPVVLPGGGFTGPTNIGHVTNNQFSILPEVKVEFGYDVTRWLRLTAGYNFMYWNNVTRAGNAIDRNFSATQPVPQFARSDFWAHGVTGGVEIKW